MIRLAALRDRRVYRYIFVGMTAFGVEFIVFTGLMGVGAALLLSQSVSFMTGLLVSFLGSRYFTFANQEHFSLNAKSQFVRYVALALFNLIMSNVFIFILVERLIVEPFIAKILVMAAIVIWNYIIFSKIIFRRK
jgi:putative flippase GtrA